jgi:hypothetical protein
MAVDWTILASWGPFRNPDAWQTNYWRIPFAGTPHIVASAYINYVSIGVLNGIPGSALAAFKRFEFLDNDGLVQEVEITSDWAFVEVDRCVSITVALDLECAIACGGWSFHFLS